MLPGHLQFLPHPGGDILDEDTQRSFRPDTRPREQREIGREQRARKGRVIRFFPSPFHGLGGPSIDHGWGSEILLGEPNQQREEQDAHRDGPFVAGHETI